MDKLKARKTVRRLGIATLILTAVFIISMVAVSFVSAGSLVIYLPEGDRAEDFVPESDLVNVRTDPKNERRMIVEAKDKSKGRVFIDNMGEGDHALGTTPIKILPNGVVVDEQNGNFSGYRVIVALITVYVLLVTAALTASFVIRCKKLLFSYTTIYYAGAALFMLGLSLDLLVSVFGIFLDPAVYHMGYIYNIITNSGVAFMLLSLPFMLVFSVMLVFCNLTLVKREGLNFVNILGFILSGLIIISYLVQIFYVGRPLTGSEREVRTAMAVDSILTTGFVYFESMLLASMLCGIISVKRRTALDKTHVIILGCAISDDGTPLPLLRGRVDRAISFARAQAEAGGREVKFVPSGGQGSDEVISEAESMKNYLISQGISEDRIIIENKSVNTQQNMRFSLEKIKADCDQPNIVFSTSNYHVLRSGIISENEGLDADGIGASTSLYFWPNAFVREFVGLLASKWKKHAFWALFFIITIAAIIMIKPM